MSGLACGSVNHANSERNRRGDSDLEIGGIHVIEVWRDGKLNRVLHAKNTFMTAALDNVLDTYFRATSQKTLWYMGLIDNATFTALANGDTAASHAGWVENQNYSGGVRPTWTPGASSGQSIVNGTAVSFSITATVTIRGTFVISDNTLGGTAGLIASTSQFVEGNQLFHNGDVLKDVYTLSATPT